MKHHSILKIALLGPESSGKTTLARELAEHFRSDWVPEYAREYIEKLDGKYTMQDIVYCATEQIRSEADKLKDAKHYLFSDTDLINLKVWLLDVYGTYPEWMEDKIKQNHYDLYLLTAPDIPFEDDPIRENPHRRNYFFEWYKKELDDYHFPYEIIYGIGPERLKNAIAATEKLTLKSRE